MDLYEIFTIVQYCVYSVILFISIVYSFLIICLRRFRHQNNIFILNLCITIILTCVYFMIYFKAIYYDKSTAICILFHYTFNIALVETAYAFVAFTVHRFCSIVYNARNFFKTKRWVIICISSQWICEFIISLPFVFVDYNEMCDSHVWMGIYTFITSVVIPVMLNTGLNILIFVHVRKSARRIRPNHISTSAITVTVHQQPKISRRDVSLLKQMIFMFIMCISGWTPVTVVHMIDIANPVQSEIVGAVALFSQLCLLSLIINLFLSNHEIRQFFLNNIRRCFHRN